MIIFKKLRWKNFLSTGNTFTEIDLCRSRSTLIVGENGAGKSTLLDALSYVLYGKPFRKINKPQLLNSINNKNLLVEVEFQISNRSYKVIRGMKPNKFEIYQNNSLINQNAEMKEYQEYFEKHILKLNHKSFSQIVILGSASFMPFMQLPAAHRREIIEDLLDIQIFSVMNLLLKEKFQSNKDMTDAINQDIKLLEQEIELVHKHINELKTNNNELKDEYLQKIETHNKDLINYETQINQINDKISVLKESIIDEPTINSKLTKMISLNQMLLDKRKKIEKDLDFYRGNDNCPTCKQELDESFKRLSIEKKNKKLAELNIGIDELNNQMKSYDNRLSEIASVMNEINEHTRSINDIQLKMNVCLASISSFKENIKQLEVQEKRIDTNIQQIEELNDKHADCITKKKDLILFKSVLDQAATLLKDGGIKTQIIKQYIPIMNKLINKYLASMDFFVNFELDEGFNEKIKSRYRDEFSYQSFSEGEKLRIDLALLFTWRAVAKLRNSASTNLLIMDEIFDSSLDNTGTEEFLKIIENLTQDTNIFIISHKGDALYDKFHSVIKFQKHKNFSRIAA